MDYLASPIPTGVIALPADLRLAICNRSLKLWHSKLQKTTALSTAEAEYYSASTAATDVLYLRNLLERMGFAQPQPTPVYEDNTACIEWGNNVIGGRERAKHIDILKHFAHVVIQNGQMKVIRVSILTKPLHFPQFLACFAGILGQKVTTTSRGGASPRLSSRVTSALKRGVSQTWVARPELDINLNLNPGDPSHSGMPRDLD